MYINVGATINGRFVQTKKALRHALLNEPERVRFFQTSVYGPTEVPYAFGVEDIKPDWNLTVVGPDPSRNRRWYASVVRVKGEVRFK